MTNSNDYRLYLEQRFADLTTLMNARFNVVDTDNKETNEHLKRINGKVAEHTKIIAENLPHTVIHCTQAKAIDELHDNMITEKAVKKFVITAVGIICALITILWTINEIFFK